MHQLRFFNTGLRGYGKHHRRDLIYGYNVQNQIRIRGNLALALQGHEDDRRCGGEALIPTRERIIFSGFHNARSHDAAHDPGFGGHQLFAEHLGVGVDVRPAPKLRPFNAEFSQTVPGPYLSFASHRQPQRIRIVGVAQFFIQSFARQLAKLGDAHCVFGFFARAFGHFCAIRDLLLHREFDAFQFVLSRKVTDDVVVLPNRSGSIARNKTS